MSLQHTKESIDTVVNTLSNAELRLEVALAEPLLQLLLVLLGVLGAHVLVADDEAAHGQTLGHNVHEVLDRVGLVRLVVVLGDHTAGDDAAEVVHGVDGGLELLAADVLVVDVDAVGGQAGERVRGLLGLVVEAVVEVQLVLDELELLVVTDRADHPEALVLGKLSDELSDGAGRGGDEDGLALLGLSDLVEGGPGGQTGHAEGTKEELGVEVVGVLELADSLDGRGVKEGVLLNWCDAECDQNLALLEVLVVRLDDLEDAAVCDGRVHLEGRRVRLLAGVTHAATLVGVERCVEVLDDKTALGDLLVKVELAGLNCEMLARNRPAHRLLLEDESLVLNHGVFVCL